MARVVLNPWKRQRQQKKVTVLAFESPRVLVLEYSCHETVFAVGKEKAAKKATGTILMTPPKSKYVVPQDLIEDPS